MRNRLILTGWLSACVLALAGCRSSSDVRFDESLSHYQAVVQQIDYPDAQVDSGAWAADAAVAAPPSVRRLEELEYAPITLEEAVQQAIAHNQVIVQAGGRIVTTPTNATTVYDPAVVETDPRFGTEAALSAFDAQLFANFSRQRQEREINSRFTINDWTYRAEDIGNLVTGVEKISAAGTRFRVDSATNYLRTNSAIVRWPNAYDTGVSAGFSHPLLQGGGVDFNRIAGPNATPGVYRGVLIARINSDIALVDFETAVRNQLRDVERAYWELYYAYRDLDAKLQGRGYALDTWQLEKRRVDAQIHPPDQEAYAREQFYAGQVAVENALSGIGAIPGVFGAERELRSLIGMPATDGKLLRPSTPPASADIRFDWEESLGLSLIRREELRRQRWRVKQRELELVAARNFEQIKLDFVGQYNIHGYGQELFGTNNSAFDDMMAGEMQGWLMGFEMRTPIGQRLGHVAVRNAELALSRDSAILREQERQVSLELRAAFTELDRAYAVTRSSYNRHVAAQTQMLAERKRNEAGDARLELVLEAQQRAVLAETALHRATADYNLALTQMNVVRGTLLNSLQVYLTEGAWSEEAHASAVREARRFQNRRVMPATVPPPVSLGQYPQRLSEGAADSQAAPEPQPATSAEVLPEPTPAAAP